MERDWHDTVRQDDDAKQMIQWGKSIASKGARVRLILLLNRAMMRTEAMRLRLSLMSLVKPWAVVREGECLQGWRLIKSTTARL